MDGFSEHADELAERNIAVIAASSDPPDKAAELAEKTGLTIGHSVDRATADALGGYWEAKREFAQPSEFVLSPSNRILHVSYSDSPLARTEAGDVLKLVDTVESRRKQG